MLSLWYLIDRILIVGRVQTALTVVSATCEAVTVGQIFVKVRLKITTLGSG